MPSGSTHYVLPRPFEIHLYSKPVSMRVYNRDVVYVYGNKRRFLFNAHLEAAAYRAPRIRNLQLRSSVRVSFRLAAKGTIYLFASCPDTFQCLDQALAGVLRCGCLASVDRGTFASCSIYYYRPDRHYNHVISVFFCCK